MRRAGKNDDRASSSFTDPLPAFRLSALSMSASIIHQQTAKLLKSRPKIQPGATIRVHERIREGEKERVQIFEGLVIAIHRGLFPLDATFTVRRIASGVGVERIFPLHSPLIEKIDVKKIAKVRRAKLNFLRNRRGKAARLSERFTEAEEFAVAWQKEESQELQDQSADPADAGQKTYGTQK